VIAVERGTKKIACRQMTRSAGTVNRAREPDMSANEPMEHERLRRALAHVVGDGKGAPSKKSAKRAEHMREALLVRVPDAEIVDVADLDAAVQACSQAASRHAAHDERRNPREEQRRRRDAETHATVIVD